MARPRTEIGAIGLPIFAGFLSLDPNARLRGQAGVKVFREMMLDEPAARALLNASYQMLRTDLSVEPGGTTANDVAAAQFLTECLSDMRDATATTLRQMYSFLWAGFDIHEIIYKRRTGGRGSKFDDGRVGWAAWALRRQETLYRWTYDAPTGAIVAFQQRPPPSYELREIPLKKCIHIVADDSEGSPEGQSVLRGMYRQWFFVKNFELLMGIALERFGTGVPKFKIAPGITLSPEDQSYLQSLVTALRQNEEAGMILPAGVDFEFINSPGLTAADYRDTIEMMRTWMLTTVMADFMALGGAHGSGAYELGRDKSELFLLALNGFQDRVLQALNRQAVERLFQINDFGALTALPRLTLPAVKRYDLEKIGAFAKDMDAIGALHVTPIDEVWLRKISDMPDVDVATLEALHDADQNEVDQTDMRRPAGVAEPPETTGAEEPDVNDDEATGPGDEGDGELLADVAEQ